MSTAVAVRTSAVQPEPHVGPARIPSLDGLRAVSILLVLVGHVGGTRGFARVDLGIGDYAHLGVVVFFVISGFLITGLLLSETASKGRVSLTRFYARRTLRLFPACYAYLSVVVALWLLGFVQLRAGDIWHAATYTSNFVSKPSWALGHLWSLSVEEQFYLLWPCAFIALTSRRAGGAAAAVVAFGPVARLAAWFAGPPYKDLELFPLVADSLAIGCLLSLVRTRLEARREYLQLFRPVYSVCILALIVVTNRYRSYSPVWVLGTSIINVGIAILIHRSVYRSGDWVGRILNWWPVVLVGTISYSLYLWQQLFLNRNSDLWINAFPQNVVSAIAVAIASYVLLEKPLLKLRHRLRV